MQKQVLLIPAVILLLVFAVMSSILAQRRNSTTPAPQVSEEPALVSEDCDPANPFLSHPGFSNSERTKPNWKENVHPTVKPMVDLQQIIACHAYVIGFSDEEPNPGYTNPRAVVHVVRWDGTDLFALGIPRTYTGKPVVIRDAGDELPRPL